MNKNTLAVTGILLFAIALSFGLPRPKYSSQNILPTLQIPMEFSNWKARDISGQLNKQGEQYNFISGVFARIYRNQDGQEILLLILDAGNFHNPKVCYGATGFINHDLPDTQIRAGQRQFKAASVYLEKGETGFSMLYWLCINKKLVSWAGQKTQELFYSILGRKKTGLMVRIDIPTSRENKLEALKIGQSFIEELASLLSPQDSEYIFGK